MGARRSWDSPVNCWRLLHQAGHRIQTPWIRGVPDGLPDLWMLSAPAASCSTSIRGAAQMPPGRRRTREDWRALARRSDVVLDGLRHKGLRAKGVDRHRLS